MTKLPSFWQIPFSESIYASDYNFPDALPNVYKSNSYTAGDRLIRNHKQTQMMKNSVLKRPLYRRGLFLLSMLLLSGVLFGQGQPIKGRVASSESDSSVAGATVTIKGQKISTTTADDGSFTISAPRGAVLVVSSVGYAPQEITVGNSATLNVRLVSSQQTIQQVVVIGYGQAKRSDVTGAISSVSADQIEKVPVTTLDQAIQGRAPGVQVTQNDAAPGGNVNVLIRGTGSLAINGNQPLYVVDGYPLETGGINNINPQDIQSLDILKDASATAVYGMRAANGVVIVTTKRGRRSGTQLFADVYEGFQSRPKTYDVLNANQFATLANTVASQSNGTFQSFSAWQNPSTLHNVDWQKALYRPGLTQSYNLGVRGGNDKVQTAASLGYYNQKGIVQGSYFKRLTFAGNVDFQPQKWIKWSANMKYSHQDQNVPFGYAGSNNLLQLSQLPPTLDSGNRQTNQIKDSKGNYGFFNPIYTYVAKYSNPLFNIDNNKFQNLTNWFLISSSLELTIFDGLRVKTNAGVTFQANNNLFFQPEDDRLVNQYGGLAGATQNATFTKSTYTNFDWLWENTLAYDKTFAKHTINFVAGVTAQKNQLDSMSGTGIPPNNTVQSLYQATAVIFNTGPGQNGQTKTTLASEFGRLTYNYDERYFITGTVRRDGSSKFAPGKQYGVFPSGAVKWRAKNESFLQDVSWITDLSLRGSWGRVGNSATIAPYQYAALFASGPSSPTVAPNYGYTFGTPKVFSPGIYPLQPANTNLQWETDEQTDIGLDASFFNGHFRFTADWYKRNSRNFLLFIPTPAQTGYANEAENVGSMVNRGLEFGLGWNQQINHDLTLAASLTASTLYNKLVSINSGTTGLFNFGNPTIAVPAMLGWSQLSLSKVGGPVGAFYGYKYLGIIQSADQIAKLNQAAQAKGQAQYWKAGTQAGDRLYADLNGDGTVNASDETTLGSPIPKVFGGLNLDATWKSFDINVYFYGQFGNKIYDFAESNLETFQNRSFVGVQNVSEDYYQHAWTQANPSDKYPRITANDDAVGNSIASSAFIKDGSFVKLKNLTVGYTFPQRVIDFLSLSRVRLYASTQNLLTITGYKGLDPEIGFQGGNATQAGLDNGNYPSSRYFTVGVNVTFK
jgi:TonB-linked SusC/RagA family outer membrane protein